MAVLDWPLLTGVIPTLIGAVGVAGLVMLLLARRDRQWWSRVVPAVIGGAAATVGLAAAVVAMARPFPDPLPPLVWWSLGTAFVAVGLSAAAGWRAGRFRRMLMVVAAVVAVLAAGNEVNRFFGEFPTVRSALGLRLAHQVDFDHLSSPSSALIAPPPGQSLSRVWRAPAGMPASGEVAEVTIPPTASHFHARHGWIYLPPAYLVTRRALLPVLVLLGGQPGSARDWLDGGHLETVMDRFASAHGGLAPVVVMPDMLGGTLSNPLCMDSHLGNAATYLAVDVPRWIRATLQVDPNPASWAVAGFSAGGTCALQLAVDAPGIYPTFVDISGQVEPTLGDRPHTLRATFGGDGAAFSRVNPLDVLSRRRFPETAGMILVGQDDAIYRQQAQRIGQATRGAGMHIDDRLLAGTHNWRLAADGLTLTLPWLSAHLHLATP
jgi:S-formylglutathione hydrolase FrmB